MYNYILLLNILLLNWSILVGGSECNWILSTVCPGHHSAMWDLYLTSLTEFSPISSAQLPPDSVSEGDCRDEISMMYVTHSQWDQSSFKEM